MSTKRGPSRSSLGPVSGDAPVRLMWSEIATMSPADQRRIDAARRVGDDQRPHAERGDDAHAEADLAGRVALVAVDAPAQQEGGLARDRSGDQAAGVAGDGRLGKAGQRRVGDAARTLQAIGDAAQAGAEHHRDVGAVDAQLLGGGVGRALHAVEEGRVQLHGARVSAAVSRNDVTACRNAPGASTCDRWPAPAIGTKRAPAIAAAICFISAAGVT